MSVTREQLEKYRDVLLELPMVETAMVEGGLIFDTETLTYYSEDFLAGRIKRLQTLIESGRY